MKSRITLVSAALDLARPDRSFADHYISSLKKVITAPVNILLYTDVSFWPELLAQRSDLTLRSLKLADLENYGHFDQISALVNQPSWYQQAAWLEHSITRSAHYIVLTLLKLQLLKSASEISPADRYVWLDAGVFSSYGLPGNLEDYDLDKIPSEEFFITSYPYRSSTEIHGFNINILEQLAGVSHSYVSRATIFSGTQQQIQEVYLKFSDIINQSLAAGAMGTEEAIFTILCLRYPELFTRYAMSSGDVNEFFRTLR